MCLLLSAAANAGDINFKQSKFMNWDYAVWGWTHLKDRAAFEAEWDTFDKPYTEWRKLYDKNPQAAFDLLEKSPDAALIKKGQSLHLAYSFWASKRRGEFWQIFEPNCYEGGDTYSLLSGNNGFRVDDIWARANIFTGKCDYPDWRVPSQVKEDADQKRAFMTQVESQRDFIEKQRRKKGL